ncbi:hypothetical protein [Ligilactobacillus equi]|uniref:hypothetical protein n=1 Tax=Ligilactobacillus equi TaxID=137357 RepID=UPI000A76754C|nr:hypothetical protein [Ligilactobacillus equi]
MKEIKFEQKTPQGGYLRVLENSVQIKAKKISIDGQFKVKGLQNRDCETTNK